VCVRVRACLGLAHWPRTVCRYICSRHTTIAEIRDNVDRYFSGEEGQEWKSIAVIRDPRPRKDSLRLDDECSDIACISGYCFAHANSRPAITKQIRHDNIIDIDIDKKATKAQIIP
jgi:hypothetical protein